MNNNTTNPAEIIDRILQTAKATVPEALSQDVKDNLRAAIQNVITDLDIVTREELDVQTEVLAKTRAKVDKMEQVISELEKELGLE